MSSKRIFEGVLLAPNLYQNERKKPGEWRYKMPNGKYARFSAATALEANKQAEFIAQNIDAVSDKINQRSSLAETLPSAPQGHEDIINEYIDYRESIDSGLSGTGSWVNRKGFIKSFGGRYKHYDLSDITYLELEDWWLGFTRHSQNSRRAEFLKFFRFLFTRRLLNTHEFPCNPFASARSGAPVTLPYAAVKSKGRGRIQLSTFYKVYDLAGDGLDFLQLAMLLSLHLGLRRGDVCALTWKGNITKDSIRLVIGKSEAQRGIDAASKVEFFFKDYPEVHHAINNARIQSVKLKSCPSVLSNNYKKTNPNRKDGLHIYAVSPNYLTKSFKYCLDILRDRGDISAAEARTSFHEIRSLSVRLLEKSGHDIKEIQSQVAHSTEEMTRHYAVDDQMVFDKKDLTISPELLAR